MAKRKYVFEQRDFACAKWMFELISKLNPSQKEPSFEAWANEIRLMREMDSRSYKDIALVFQWANKHGFWKTNILSPQTLRRQFDRLNIQMNNSATKSQMDNLKDALQYSLADLKAKYGNSKAPKV